MNYYNPNYYMNPTYPYNNQYPLPQFQQQQTFSQNNNLNSNNLNGKIVDSEDVVKATEVPIGGYGIFPKADLSEIYIKSWNNNGTTSVITFKPITPIEVPHQNEEDLSKMLLQKIELLENKIDMIIPMNQTNAAIQPQQEMKKAEVPKNGF